MTHRPIVWAFIALDVVVALFFTVSAFAGIPFMSSYAVELGADSSLPLAVAFSQLGFAFLAATAAYLLWRNLRLRWLLQVVLLVLLATGTLQVLRFERERSSTPAQHLPLAVGHTPSAKPEETPSAAPEPRVEGYTGHCSTNAANVADRLEFPPIDDAQEPSSYDEFYEKLRTAVANDDRGWVARHVQYPRSVYLDGSKKNPAEICNAAEFVRLYERIMLPRLKRILQTTAKLEDAVGPLELADGVLSFFQVCAEDTTQYCPAGPIRIIGIRNDPRSLK